MWFEYLKEREGKEYFEIPNKGFTIFTIENETCYISDVFVKKEHRGNALTSQLADGVVKIAKERGCKILCGSVDPKAPGATVSLHSQLHYGLQLCHEFKDGLIFLYKEI